MESANASSSAYSSSSSYPSAPPPGSFCFDPFVADDPKPSSSSTSQQQPPQQSPQEQPPPQPSADLERTCRICFATTPPPYDPDPDLGPLISPCTCRGSSRYVHRQCLQQWRTLAPNRTAFYQCPTCKYRYRFRRLRLASALSSTSLQLGLTIFIMGVIVWVLGFVSEPLLKAYMGVASVEDIEESLGVAIREGGWVEHFIRGLASLGLLGFLKVIYFLGPGSWWNLRNSGILGGRERVSRLSWIVVAVGVINFFYWIWKKVGGYVERWMHSVAREVMEVGEEGDAGA